MEPIFPGQHDREHEPPVNPELSVDVLRHRHEGQAIDDGEEMDVDEINKADQGSAISVTFKNKNGTSLVYDIESKKDSVNSVTTDRKDDQVITVTVTSESLSAKNRHSSSTDKGKEATNKESPIKDKIAAKVLPPAGRTKRAATIAAHHDSDSDETDLGLIHLIAANVKTSLSPGQKGKLSKTMPAANKPGINDTGCSDGDGRPPSETLLPWIVDDSDQVCVTKYIDDYAALPADRGPGYPRIIAEGQPEGDRTWYNSDVRAADGVVTYLHRCTGLTGALEKFLDMSKSYFCLVTRRDPRSPSGFGIEISRHDERVQAGVTDTMDYERGWDMKVDYDIQPDGKWMPISGQGVLGAYKLNRAEEVETHGFEVANSLVWNDNVSEGATTTMYYIDDEGEERMEEWDRNSASNDQQSSH